MLGDVLLIEEKHKIVGKQLAEMVLKQGNKRLIVAISGESGSGKSELSHCMAMELKGNGLKAKILHSDDYYKISPKERGQWRVDNQDKIGLDEYDWDKIEQNIDDFKNERVATTPSIDILTDQEDELITDFKGIDILIMDGLYAINLDSADIRVLIDITYHNTKKAQLKRGKEKMDEMRLKVLMAEHKAVQFIRHKATVVVSADYKIV